jgi:hypothetical protein
MHPTQNPVSATVYQPAIADTLRRAALYLIRHGWIQDNHYANEMTPVILRTPTLPAADVLGALVLAVTGRTLTPAQIAVECGHNAAHELRDAVAYLVDWLGLEDRPGLDDQRALWDWNDAPWQDKAHVIDGLLSAAADADGTIYKPGTHRPYAADFAALDLKAGVR